MVGREEMKYIVEARKARVGAGNFLTDEVVFEETGLSKKAAMEKAEVMSSEGMQVFVSWYRASDGQIGYLNPGGNHEPVGKAW